MDVEADTLDVYDTEKRAVFHGNVKSKQGDFVVRTVEMIAFYTGQAGLGCPAAAMMRQQDAVAADARGSQTEGADHSKDGQTATGDWAHFDIKANTVLMGDDVTVSRGKDVAQGPRLKIDLTTGMYRFELEQEPPWLRQPRQRALRAAHGADPNQPGRAYLCAGQAVLLFYPKEAQNKAKGAIDKVLPGAPPSPAAKIGDSWEPSTNASPTLRSD